MMKLYKIRFSVIFTVVFLSSLSETQFSGSVAKNGALSDAQLQEIERLRDDLVAVFKNFDKEQFNVKAPAIIVQPAWTQQRHGKNPPFNHMVQVTPKLLQEAEAIRAEINKAVAKNTYVARENRNRHDDSQMKKLLEEFSAEQDARASLDSILADNSKTGTGSEQLDPAADLNAHPKSAPNIVEASAFDVHDIDIRKLQSLEISKRRTKEMLILKSVEEDFSFDLGDDVQQWAHIMHNGTEYFVGRRDTDLFIVHKDNTKYRSGVVMNVGRPISYLLTYSYWNLAQAQQEGVILVASGDQVLWYRGSNVTGRLTLDWNWTVGSSISGLTYFTLDGKNYLIVSSNEQIRAGYYTLNIYQFDLLLHEFWIAQRLQLQYPCSETTVLDTGRDVILAIPQYNTTAIYAFNPHVDATDHLRFQLRRNIDSEAVETVAAFRMGGRSYLALSGLQPQILLYESGELNPKTILGQNFGLVQMFLPVPVRTYRDDLILFVQHHVDFGTHGLTVLETLIWDGEAFEASIPVPCQQGTHTSYGVSCMLDIQRDEGLKGAEIFRRGDEVSIIVPRDNAESGLYRLHTELLARNSELIDLQETYKFLQDWVREQDELMVQAQKFLSISDEALLEDKPDFSELQQLQTPELRLGDVEIDELFVNDYKWTEEDSSVELMDIFNAIKTLSNELDGNERRRRDVDTSETEKQLPFEELELERVEVEELLVRRVNGANYFVQQGALDFDGIVNVQQLTVLEKINVRQTRETDPVEPLVVANDIEFDTINGMDWNELRENFIFTNQSIDLTKLEVEGDVIAEDKLSLQFLNSLAFPDDYLWSNGSSVSIVKAPKTFKDTLSVNVMDIESSINGVNPQNAITLRNPQNWQGSPTFAQLRVSEVFQLNGTMRGQQISNLPNNPTLKDALSIEAKCNFRQLLVNGTILLQELYAGQPLAPLLLDVVQRSEDPDAEISISSQKTFSSVTMPVDFNIKNNSINEIPITQFVPAHTQQTLNLTALHAHVYFQHLNLNGSYDGVDIREFLHQAIKLNDSQWAPTTQLNFAQPFDALSLNVNSSLNGVPIRLGYQTLSENINIPTAYFEHLTAKVADIPNDIKGVDVQLNGWNMPQYMGQQTPNYATGNIYIEELTLPQGLDADKIHGINATHIFQFLQNVDDLTEMILDGKIKVDNVIVAGDVYVSKLNQQQFDEDLQLTVVWLNRPNYLSASLRFAEPLLILGNLNVLGAYNDQQNLPDLIRDMIFRGINATTIVLAPKSFASDLHVLGETHIDAINGLPFSQIATKKTLCNFRGSLEVRGILEVHELELGGAFNMNPMSTLGNVVRFDRQTNAFIIQGAVRLGTSIGLPLYLQTLNVNGNLNDLPQLGEFFADLVYKDRPCLLIGHNVFTGRVSIENGAYIRELNGYNLVTLLNNIIYLHEPRTVYVKSPIVFKSKVIAENAAILQTLDTSRLCGCELKEWINNTLRIDQPQEITSPLTFAPNSINGNSFYVSFLNEVDLSQLITLNTIQNLSTNLAFSAIYLDGQIQTEDLVNNVDLQQEYQNTLLTHGNQHITTPLTLRSATVLHNLQTNAPINNNKDLRYLATLQDDLQFESPLFFSNLSVKTLRTRHLISGINMNQWFEAALWTRDKPQQLVTGNWSARSLTVKKGPTLPTYMSFGASNGANTRNVRAQHSYKRLLCEKLAKRIKHKQKRAYLPKYLEESFTLRSESFELPKQVEAIRAVYVLRSDEDEDEEVYLLVNHGCHTHMLKWQARVEAFEKHASFESGHLVQVLLTSRDQGVWFVTLSENANCIVSGLNLWHLTQRHVTLHKSLGQNLVQMQYVAGKLYALGATTVYGYNLTAHNQTNSWLLPTWLGAGSYRFVPQPQMDALVLTNGAYIVAFNDDTLDETARNKRNSTSRYSLPLHYHRAAQPMVLHLTETVLQSTSADHHNVTQSYEFEDFRALIWRILDDLDYRLRLEVNITQLSIPESDLFDEHLVRDFLDIMQELRRQDIYPKGTFNSVNLRALRIPNNPAQVLAARTVQIIWPVIVEMQEIQGYLRKPEAPTDPVCADIITQLGATVRDVLLLANRKTSAADKSQKESAAHFSEMTAVIERIRVFQHYMHNVMGDLQAREYSAALAEEFGEDIMEAAASTNPLSVATSDVLSSLSRNDSKWLKITSNHLPAHGHGELLPLEVGASDAPINLLAVTHTQITRNRTSGINLYMDVLSGSGLFQSIATQQSPHALAVLRIGAQTLLTFSDGCCDVRVYIYRGVEGFVEFAHFKSPYGKVLQLFMVFLPTAQQEGHYYLATVHASRVVFYRIVATGKQLSMPPICYE